MSPADAAMQSDPMRNRQFRRLWTPPDPDKRERRPRPGAAPQKSSQQINDDNKPLARQLQVLRLRQLGIEGPTAIIVAQLVWGAP
jgi:hypothetical protein